MKQLKLLTAAILLIMPLAANADLITNGNFDSDLSGWDQAGDIATTWDAGTAHLGHPGTLGTSLLFQVFDIQAGTSAVSISFDYQWQVTAPAIEDFFVVRFDYVGSLFAEELVYQGSTAAVFGSTVSFSKEVKLPDLGGLDDLLQPDVPLLSGFIAFILHENNSSNGTRIQLDNIAVRAVSVPEPGTLALLGLGLAGIGMTRRKKKSETN